MVVDRLADECVVAGRPRSSTRPAIEFLERRPASSVGFVLPTTAAIDLDTIAALVSLLLLLAPGMVWQVQQTRHEPSVKESRLVEVSRVVIAPSSRL